jgi:hypothetical protein
MAPMDPDGFEPGMYSGAMAPSGPVGPAPEDTTPSADERAGEAFALPREGPAPAIEPAGAESGLVGPDPDGWAFWNTTDLIGRETLPGLLMAVGIMLMLFILLRRLWRRKPGAGGVEEATARERIEVIRARAGERARVDSFKVDAHEFTRQMAALLDTKGERLERLIAEADERIARLESARRGGGRAGGGEEPALRTAARAERGGPRDPMHERIYELSDAGMGVVEIARQTGQPTGQVELILALRG